MAIVPFKKELEKLKIRLKNKVKPSLKKRQNLRLPDDLFELINMLAESKKNDEITPSDVIREALEIDFFYGLYLGNIDEKISPADDRFDRLECLIKDSFQMAFGRGPSADPKDFTIMDILLNMIAQQAVQNMTSDQIENYRKTMGSFLTNFNKEFYENRNK